MKVCKRPHKKLDASQDLPDLTEALKYILASPEAMLFGLGAFEDDFENPFLDVPPDQCICCGKKINRKSRYKDAVDKKQ